MENVSQPPCVYPPAVSSSCLLDTESSSEQKLKLGFRESLLLKHRVEYDAVVGLYKSMFKQRKIERLDTCRTHAKFVREIATGKVKVVSSSCHVKFCPLCTSGRAFHVRLNTTKWLMSIQYPKLITLTVKHSDDPLRSQLDDLYKNFRELRRINLWKSAVKGGVWFFEIKKGADDKWHPHIHIAAQSAFISKAALSKAWKNTTETSFIVDIKCIRDIKKTAEYVAKYALKPCELNKLEMSDRQNLFLALEHRRLCGTFGTAKQAKLTARPKYDETLYQVLGSFDSVVHTASCDPNSRIILSCWQNGEAILEGIEVTMYDDFIAGALQNKPPPVITSFDSWLF